MLILIKQIVRRGAEFSRVMPIGLNPEIIDRATEGEVIGYDGPCVELQAGDETIFCEGTVEEIVRQTWYPQLRPGSPPVPPVPEPTWSVRQCPEPADTDTE